MCLHCVGAAAGRALNTLVTITAPASQVCLGNAGGHFAEVVSLPSASPPFSCSSTAPLCKLALTSAGGSALCSWGTGMWGGWGSAQEEETGNKVLLPGAAFPRSTASRSLSLGHHYLGDRVCQPGVRFLWEEGHLCLMLLPLCPVSACEGSLSVTVPMCTCLLCSLHIFPGT